jgi:hypothetical protein
VLQGDWEVLEDLEVQADLVVKVELELEVQGGFEAKLLVD